MICSHRWTFAGSVSCKNWSPQNGQNLPPLKTRFYLKLVHLQELLLSDLSGWGVKIWVYELFSFQWKKSADHSKEVSSSETLRGCTSFDYFICNFPPIRHDNYVKWQDKFVAQQKLSFYLVFQLVAWHHIHVNLRQNTTHPSMTQKPYSIARIGTFNTLTLKVLVNFQWKRKRWPFERSANYLW